jgi:hypothetical protein
MTDHLLPPDELDELATAYVDGVATQAQRAQVHADPVLAARVEALVDLRGRLAEPLDVSAHARDAHLAAALAVFAETHPGETNPGETPRGEAPIPAPVRSLDEARARRARRWAPALSVAAASVLVLGTGMLALNRGGRGGGDSVDASGRAEAGTPSTGAPATVAAAVTAASGLGAGGSADEEMIAKASPPTVAPADADMALESVAVGDAIPFAARIELDSPTQLAATVESYGTAAAADPANPANPAPTPASFDPCPQAGRTYLANVVWQGQPAYLYVAPDRVAPASAIVLSSTCVALASAALAG